MSRFAEHPDATSLGRNALPAVMAAVMRQPASAPPLDPLRSGGIESQIQYDCEALYAPALYGLVFGNDHRSLDVLKMWGKVPPAVQAQCFEVDPREVNFEFARQAYSYSAPTPHVSESGGVGGADQDDRSAVPPQAGGQQHAADGVKRAHGYLRASLDRFYLDKLQVDCGKLIRTSLLLHVEKVQFETLLRGQCDKKQSNPIDPPVGHPEVQQLYNLDGGPSELPCVTYGTTCGRHGELFYFTRRKPSDADRENNHWFEVRGSVMQVSALAHFLWTSIHMSWLRVLRCCSYFAKAVSQGLPIPRQEARTLAPGDYGVASTLGTDSETGKPTGMKIHSVHSNWTGVIGGRRRSGRADGLGPVGGMLRAIESKGGLASALASVKMPGLGGLGGAGGHADAIDEEPEPGLVAVGPGGLVPLPKSALGVSGIRPQYLQSSSQQKNQPAINSGSSNGAKGTAPPHENPAAIAIAADPQKRLHLTNINQMIVRLPKLLAQGETFHRLITHANHMKGAGNQCYRAGRYEEACALYTRALLTLPPEACKVRCLLLSNRSACHLKLGNYWLARFDCSKVIDVNPRYVKSAFRRAVASTLLGDHQAAMCDLFGLIEIVSAEIPEEIIHLMHWLVQSAPPGTCPVSKALADKVVRRELEYLRAPFGGGGASTAPNTSSIATTSGGGGGITSDPLSAISERVERESRKRQNERQDQGGGHNKATVGTALGEKTLAAMNTEIKRSMQQYLIDTAAQEKGLQQASGDGAVDTTAAASSASSGFAANDRSWLEYYATLIDPSPEVIEPPVAAAKVALVPPGKSVPTAQETEKARLEAMARLMLDDDEGRVGKGRKALNSGKKGGGKKQEQQTGKTKISAKSNIVDEKSRVTEPQPEPPQHPGARGEVVLYTNPTNTAAPAPMEYHAPTGPVLPLDLMWEMD